MKMRHLLVLLASVCFFTWSGTASAVTYTHNVCIKLRTGFVDGATGDFGTGSTWVGRGVTFAPATGGLYFTSPSTGCAIVYAATPVIGPITIYAQSVVGASNNIVVRSFPTSAAMDTYKTTPSYANLPKWIVNVAPTCSGTVCVSQVTNTASSTDAVSNLHAAATWGVYHIDGDSPTHLSGAREMYVHNSGCGSASVSCGGQENLSIQSANNGARRKFLIGHEVGHWFHANWGFNFSSGDYAVQETSEPACNSEGIPGDHALRSLEYQRAAFVEGFAHYMSTLAYNEHVGTHTASFHYYKDTGAFYDNEVVAVGDGPTGGDTNWWENGCDCPSCEGDLGAVTVPAEDMSTEIDWLRALWDFRTDNGVAPTHNQVFDVVTNYVSQRHTYDDLTAEVVPGFLTRWIVAATVNGVAH